MNDDNQPVTKKVLDESLEKMQESLVGGMNQIVTTLVNHIDKRFVEVDDKFEKIDARFDRLDLKLDNTLDDHEVRVTKLERAA